nr:tetraketide alpha-pyrone reductase 1 [Quercus suber]
MWVSAGGPVCRELKATMESQDRDEIHNCVIKLRVNPQKRREKVYIGCGAGFGAERTLAERNQFMVSGGDGYDSWSGVGGCRIVPVVAVVLLRQWPHLLQRGYTVKATVRDTNDPKKTEHLLSLDGAKERLQLFKADLLVEGSFDSAVDGCQCVFHTASPVTFTASDPQSELIDPAVKGTLNVLRSCAKVHSIKRVIVTSSMAAVMFNKKPLTPDVVIDETWFSDPVACEELKLWYMIAKTLAEEAAWTFAKENGIDLVTINPGFVIGPLIQPTLTFSLEGFLKIIHGTQIFPDGIYRLVDVRDVANAHIQAFENPAASGRYCIVGGVTHYSEVFKILRKFYPSLWLPEKSEDDKPLQPLYKISQDKAISLGINFIPLEVSVRDTVESFKENGIITI